VTDVYEELPEFAGGVMRLLFSQPVYIRSIGAFTGTVTGPDGTVTPLELSGISEYAIVR
jgi:hypothetical protein